MIGYGVSQIDFIDGTTEVLPERGIVLIVGPNNAGKSSLIREIYEGIEGQRSHLRRRWVERIHTARSGTDDEFRKWFKEFTRIVPGNRPNEGVYGFWDEQMGGGYQTWSIDSAAHSWLNGEDLGPLKRKLVGYYPAMTREGLIGGRGPRNVMTPATDPLSELWDSTELEQTLSRIMQRAFGFPISLNRYAPNPAILCGKPGMPDEPLPPSKELLEAYGNLFPLSEQGDGIKSFAGLALHSITGRILITLIDEPEAFLHPPQAKLLGRLLSSEAPQTGQLIIATHSSHILEGILDGASDREVKIIRLDNVADSKDRSRSILPPDRISQLWKDPLLRYSHLLDGLFHRGVVVCEADSDCRFYTAVLDTFMRGRVEHDLLFTYVGGKGRLAQAAGEMTRFKVPVAVIGDLDVLRQEGQIEAIIQALNGDPGEYTADLATIRSEINSRGSAPLMSSVKDAFAPFMRAPNNARIGEKDAETLSQSIRLRSGWKEVKRSGISTFEGESYQAVSRVINKLSEIGLLLVPVGELERWYPNVDSRHGPAFVSALLEKGHHNSIGPELELFLKKLANRFRLA